MSEEKREFKGIWFPAEVWLDERLTALEKMILMEIDSLDNENNCYASNEHLAKFCQCSQSKVSSAISKLKKLGYVRVKSFDGRKRILESCLTVSIGQPNKKEKAAQQNLEERVLAETTSESTKEDIPFSAIIDHLNEKAGTRFRASTPKTQAHVRARWNEGYRLDDFLRVIDVKCADWLGDEKMGRYLCPDTLFGTKFEKYLNQPVTRSRAKEGKGRNDAYNFENKPDSAKVTHQQDAYDWSGYDDIRF